MEKIPTEITVKNEIKEGKKMPEIAKKLFLFSHKHNNPVVFQNGEYGQNVDINDLKIKKEVLEHVREKDLHDLMLVFLKGFKAYLNGPIFTDTFNTFHDKRRVWERRVGPQMEPEIRKYYEDNRLNNNKTQNIIGGLNVITGNFNDSEIKDKLQMICDEIHIGLPELYTVKGENGPRYNILNDSEKVEKIERLSKKVREVLEIIEEKPENLTESK